MDILKLVGNREPLFLDDIERLEAQLKEIISGSSFLVVGGAGSIGQAVTKEIFKRNPKLLHVVDLSENNLVELVRDIRSSIGYGDGAFETYAVDCGSIEFRGLMDANEAKYDFVLNLSALKHVRSESDPFTLMRLLRTNILNTLSNFRLVRDRGAKKYFCVSTDKAANPVNMMGASKRIMEMFLMRESETLPVSMARFANVAFSDGSLLHGFERRVEKAQPISAPSDIRRYFVTSEESGILCLFAAIYGENLDIYFPKLTEDLHLLKFSDIAREYLSHKGYEPFECETEAEARERSAELIGKGFWPCYFFETDTTGEKDFEEFYTNDEKLDWNSFKSIGVIKNLPVYDDRALKNFEEQCNEIIGAGTWSKGQLLNLFLGMLPDFDHKETGKYLDQRM